MRLKILRYLGQLVPPHIYFQSKNFLDTDKDNDNDNKVFELNYDTWKFLSLIDKLIFLLRVVLERARIFKGFELFRVSCSELFLAIVS